MKGLCYLLSDRPLNIWIHTKEMIKNCNILRTNSNIDDAISTLFYCHEIDTQSSQEEWFLCKDPGLSCKSTEGLRFLSNG